jgi:hypothetical protein
VAIYLGIVATLQSVLIHWGGVLSSFVASPSTTIETSPQKKSGEIKMCNKKQWNYISLFL